MNNRITNNIFSKTFLLVTGIVYFLNYIYSNVLPEWLSLEPAMIIKQLNLWKLVTFPFAPGGAESIFLFALVFYFISSKLEAFIEGPKYPLWLFLLTLLQGCILTLVFINSNIIIAGMDGISFYILVVYSLLRPKEKIYFLNFPPMPVLAFSTLLAFIWFGLKLVNFSTGGDNALFLSALGSSLFGITAGLIHFLQIRLTGLNSSRNTKIENSSEFEMPSPEEISISHTTNAKLRKLYQPVKADYLDEEAYLLSEDMSENEDKLNEILDKISTNGKESLTPLERRFLHEYSKKL